MKRSLHIGINDYPGSGNDLSGCVNDALDWTKALAERGYETHTILDSDATRTNVLWSLRSLVAGLGFGDRLVVTYSGHGSWVPDRNGDEEDARDETLVLHDWQTNGLLTDDELHTIFWTRKWGSRITFISDSCHSGTVHRIASVGVPRYFPAELLTPALGLYAAEPVRRTTRKPSGTLLMSGSADHEFSYDAWFDGRPQGAFSKVALEALADNPTMARWHSRIRAVLPSTNYPQSPQLQARGWQRYWRL